MKRSIYIFKSAIFVFGILVYFGAYYAFTGGHPTGGNDDLTLPNAQFLWTTIGIVYLVFFFPLFFGRITFATFITNPATIVLLWWTDCVFCVSSLIFAVLVYKRIVDPSVALLVEGIVVFLGLVIILAGLLSGEQISAVEVKENRLMSNVTALRASFDNLNIRVQRCANVPGEIKSEIARCTEDVRYMSGVSGITAIDLESRIHELVEEIDDNMDKIERGSPCTTLSSLVNNLVALIAERKMCVN